jgi:phage baseplate assembly protein W
MSLATSRPGDPARHPWRVTGTRQLTSVGLERHIADLVRLVLLTGPGERLHHPDFGAGLGAAALFEPLQPALLGIIEVRARGSLNQALGDRIEITEIKIAREGESTITAAVTYRLKPAGSPTTVVVAVLP